MFRKKGQNKHKYAEVYENTKNMNSIFFLSQIFKFKEKKNLNYEYIYSKTFYGRTLDILNMQNDFRKLKKIFDPYCYHLKLRSIFICKEVTEI